jgi:hypothetical protein
MSARAFLPVLLLAGVVACSKRAPEPARAAAATAPVNAAASRERLAPNDERHGTRKLMGLDTPVFVDGVQAAVLRFGEMPPVPAIEMPGGSKRFRLYDYLKGIGITPEQIKSVHLHGNNDRIASVEGSELLKEKDRFIFKFLSGETGAPITRWSTTGLKNTFVIHEIRRMTIYVTKPSPSIHPDRQCHVGPDGQCSDAIPYDASGIAKGTRVYLDGKMIGAVKRRLVGDDLVVKPGEEAHYSLNKLIAQMGVDPATVNTAEIVAGDEVIARAKGIELAQLAPYFLLPKHGHGKVKVHVPAEIQAHDQPGVTDRDAFVSAVVLYRAAAPTKERDLVAISEDTDLSVKLASIDEASREQTGRGEQ